MNKILSDKITINSLQEAFLRKSYQLPIGAHFINPIGIRAATGFTNLFDDIFCLMYRNSDDVWTLEKFACTTEPGKYYLQQPMNAAGTGILAPGQYLDSHKIGLHQGKYKALVQKGPMKLYRDADRDTTYDLMPEKIESGIFGVNIHRANEKTTSTLVEKWSAACQVLASPVDFNRVMDLASTHEAVYGNSFNYTLLMESEL